MISLSPPTPPPISHAIAGNAEVTLNWEHVFGATEYRIYRDGDATAIETISIVSPAVSPAITYTDEGRTNGTEYSYTVNAANDAGESAVSSSESTTPIDPPVAPDNFAASPGNQQIILSWDIVTGATSYRLYRATSASASATRTRITTSPATLTANSYTDSSLTNGTAYTYTVRAVNGAVESVDSSVQTATPIDPPSAPANFTATAVEQGVTLSWSAVTGATAYRIYRATSSSASATRARITTSPATLTAITYIDRSVTADTAYTYSVRAVKSSAESVDSSPQTATPTDHANTRSTSATTVTSPSATAAGYLSVGDTDYFKITVAGAGTLRAYTTSNKDTVGDIYDSSNTSLASDNNGGANFNFDVSYSVTTAGTYYIRVIEGNQDDVASYTLNVLFTPTPDLTITSVTIPSSVVMPGDTFTLSITVENEGSVQAPSSTLTYYHSTDVTLSSADTPQGTDTVGVLAANGSSSESVSITAPTTEGIYYYGGCVSTVAGETITNNQCSSVSVTVTSTAVTPPSAPTNFAAILGDQQVTLSWSSVTSATAYRIYRATSSSASATRARITTSPATLTAITYTDKSVTNGTAYTYSVRAVNSAGESVDGSPQTATPTDHANTRSTSATTVTSPSATAGYLSANEFDYFKITVAGAGTLRAYTTGSIDTIGDIYGSSGASLAKNDDSSGSNTNFDVSYSVTTADTYYIQVRGFFGVAGSYTLHVSFTP